MIAISFASGSAKSGFVEANHFADVGKMIDLAKGAQREIADIKLTRYTCLLSQKRNP